MLEIRPAAGMRWVVPGQRVRLCSQPLGQQQSPVAERLSNDSMFLPTSSADPQRARQQDWFRQTPKPARQKEVLHEPDLGETTDRFKRIATNKYALIAIRQTVSAGTVSITVFNHPVDPAWVVNPLPKGAAQYGRVAERLANLPQAIVVEPVVCVQKKKNIALGLLDADILLAGTAASTLDNLRAPLTSDVASRVLRASVDDQDFERLRRPGSVDCRGDGLAFIERGNDDGDVGRHRFDLQSRG